MIEHINALQNNKKTVAIVCVILWIIMFYFQYMTPYMTDNFLFSRYIHPSYADFYAGGNIISMEELTLEKAWKQSLTMYFTWCGRFSGNFIVYLLFMLPHILYCGFVASAFILYIFLIIICVYGLKWKEILSASKVMFIVALLWISLPSFGSTFFWLSVGGYIALIGQAIFFIPFRLAFDKIPDDQNLYNFNITRCISFFLIAFIIAMLDYATAASLPLTGLFAVLYLFLRQHKNNRKFPWLYIFGTLGVSIGGFVTLLAPGNYMRIKLTSDETVKEYISNDWPTRLIDYISNIPLSILYHCVPLIIVFFSIVYIRKKYGSQFLLIIPKEAYLFFIPFILTHGAYIFTAFPPPRAFTTTAGQIIITSLILLNCVNIRNVPLDNIKYFKYLKIVLFSYFIVTLPYEMYLFAYVHKKISERETIYKNNQGRDVYVPMLDVNGDRYMVLGSHLNDLRINKNFWVNRATAAWYGVKSISVVPKIDPTDSFNSKLHDNSILTASVFFNNDKDTISITSDYTIKVSLKTNVEPKDLHLHLYYFGKPGLISRLPYKVGTVLSNWLNSLDENFISTKLILLLYSRLDINLHRVDETTFTGEGHLLGMYPAKRSFWIVNPKKYKYSSDLIKIR